MRVPLGGVGAALIGVLGLSFWFFLGFPWGHHSESYSWVFQLERIGLWGAVSGKLYPMATVRPLGSLTAWLLYRIGDGSIVAAQLFNYGVAVLAWTVLHFAVSERRCLALVSLVCTGLFFSGYIYLFHLHGIFYSPVLLQLAALFVFLSGDFEMRRWILVSCVSLVAALYHPFALLLYAAVCAGLLAERARVLKRRELCAAIAGLACSLVLIAVTPSSNGFRIDAARLTGFVTSYGSVDFHLLTSMGALGLAVLTLCLEARGNPGRFGAVLAIGVTALVFRMLLLPWLLLWVITCLLKAVWRRRFAAAAVVLSTGLLPLITATGSPTYVVFTLMACSAVTVMGATAVERSLSCVNGWTAATLIVCAVILGVTLRSGTHVPVLSKLVNPLLAEREKTLQLEQAIVWMEHSIYRDHRLTLCHEAAQPAVATNAIDRRYRPPTQQSYLDDYLEARVAGGPAVMDRPPLLVCFGDERLAGTRVVGTLPGVFNGDAVLAVPQTSRASS